MTDKRSTGKYSGHRIVMLTVLCLFGFCLVFANIAVKPKKKVQKKDERVYLLHSDELYYDVMGPNPEAQIVKGHVSFMHQGAHLKCDSAYFYQQQNSVRAMGHVHFTQGDTLSMTCDHGFYDGQMQMLEARKNVVLKHRKQTLLTDSLNYDRLWENAYFTDGGKLIDGKNTLVADWGTYNTSTKQAVFNYHVVMLNDKQRIETDTLHYDTQLSLAHVTGPSVITQDSAKVNTTDGYFDSKTDKSRLFSRSTIVNGQKNITGDSLYYDKNTGDAEGFGRVVYVDTQNKNELHGEHVVYNEKTGYGFATEKALVKDYSQKDTLYMHSDSIKLYTFNINTDSVYRKVHCFNKVRAYRVDLQAVCDSLVGDSRDSCMMMYHDPIAWNGNRQVTGDMIKVYSNDSTIREANVVGNAMSIEKCDDDGHYNQISSNLMNTFFVDGNVRTAEAIGNVKVIYYPLDDQDSTLMLLNYTETDTLRMYLTPERQMEKVWTSKHVSDMYPMTQIPPEKKRLPGFVLYDELRPKDKDDIFDREEQTSKPEEMETPKDAPKEDTKTEAKEEPKTEQKENKEVVSEKVEPQKEIKDNKSKE